MPRYLFTKQIEAAIIQGIRDCAADILAVSQNLVPVKTGKLKRSGKMRKIPKGAEIIYKREYAAAVEFGRRANNAEAVRRHWVRPHYRKFNHCRSIMKTRRVAGGLQRIGIQTHTISTMRTTGGTMSKTLKPIDIKRRMKNKVFVNGHYRGPFTRKIYAKMGKFYLTQAVDNIYPDVLEYIRRALNATPAYLPGGSP